MKVKLWGKNRATPPGEMLSISVHIKIGFLNRMLRFLSDGVLNDKRRLKRLSEKYPVSEDIFDSLHESLGDEFWVAEEGESFGRLLAIVGLYMLVESETKTILKWIFPEKQVLKAYNWKHLRNLLENCIGFNIEDLKMFNIINELRCLNNDIKHSRRVGKELAEYPDWAFGQEISIKEIDFNRFKNAIPTYVQELSDGINKRCLELKPDCMFKESK